MPNEDALLMFEEIERSFTGLAEINGLSQQLRHKRGRRLSIACTPVFAAAVLPRVRGRYRSEAPGAFCSVHSRSADHVAALVSSQKADIGFALHVPPIPGVRSEILAEVPMVCYLPPGHRLARERKPIRAADLLGEPMISLSHNEGIAEIVGNAFRGCGGPPVPVVECPAALAACSMVAAGIGFTIFDSLPATLLAPNTFSVHAFEPSVKLVYRAYWFEARGKPFDRERLLALARSELQSLTARWNRDTA
jgi:DNA-binding transcriptional LysR family regulator